ncbi:unnamed protein product [Dovyalis caffra]|uniref:RING-type E3 ubiquitin transferase n=1 Tax=Dovyalis caffra TaxID=77055 RepID=A0AAV1RF42_9ROSI|nr:unnamed protein product [Dovyalis caffra]
MEPSSSIASRRSQKQNHEKFLFKEILPAIRGHSCPICLKDFGEEDYRRVAVITVCLHAYCLDCIRKWSDFKRKCPLCNSEFDSWFCRISVSSRKFLTEKLPVVKEGKMVTLQADFSARDRQRLIERCRAELNIANRRTRPLPWRRTFGQPRPGSVDSQAIAQRKLQWRASIYNRRMHAVPISSRNCLDQVFSSKSPLIENVSRDGCMKERILQRVEPWIQRELQAILEDPDPSVIVHLASSLFIASLERKSNVQLGQLGTEDNFLEPLLPFLRGWTNTFWHELSQIKRGTRTSISVLSRVAPGGAMKLC